MREERRRTLRLQDPRRLTMRTMFITYLLIIWVGLAYFIALGLIHH
jgi:hypothetical protein